MNILIEQLRKVSDILECLKTPLLKIILNFEQFLTQDRIHYWQIATGNMTDENRMNNCSYFKAAVTILMGTGIYSGALIKILKLQKGGYGTYRNVLDKITGIRRFICSFSIKKLHLHFVNVKKKKLVDRIQYRWIKRCLDSKCPGNDIINKYNTRKKIVLLLLGREQEKGVFILKTDAHKIQGNSWINTYLTTKEVRTTMAPNEITMQHCIIQACSTGSSLCTWLFFSKQINPLYWIKIVPICSTPQPLKNKIMVVIDNVMCIRTEKNLHD